MVRRADGLEAARGRRLCRSEAASPYERILGAEPGSMETVGVFLEQVRTVRENAMTLKLDPAEFEEESPQVPTPGPIRR